MNRKEMETNQKRLLQRIERLERIIVELAGDALDDSTTWAERGWGDGGLKELTTDGSRLRADVAYRDTREVRRIKSWGEFQ